MKNGCGMDYELYVGRGQICIILKPLISSWSQTFTSWCSQGTGVALRRSLVQALFSHGDFFDRTSSCPLLMNIEHIGNDCKHLESLLDLIKINIYHHYYLFYRKNIFNLNAENKNVWLLLLVCNIIFFLTNNSLWLIQNKIILTSLNLNMNYF